LVLHGQLLCTKWVWEVGGSLSPFALASVTHLSAMRNGQRVPMSARCMYVQWYMGHSRWTAKQGEGWVRGGRGRAHFMDVRQLSSTVAPLLDVVGHKLTPTGWTAARCGAGTSCPTYTCRCVLVWWKPVSFRSNPGLLCKLRDGGIVGEMLCSRPESRRYVLVVFPWCVGSLRARQLSVLVLWLCLSGNGGRHHRQVAFQEYTQHAHNTHTLGCASRRACAHVQPMSLSLPCVRECGR
jgi:hypothetical protein